MNGRDQPTEIVTILRDLWHQRALVVAAGVLAVLAGLFVAYSVSFPPKLESRKYDVGVATARILVDTPSSQVVEVAPKGSDTLGVRANLLANLMVDGVVKNAIAKRAGLRPDQIQGAGADDPAPKGGRRANVLTTRVVTDSTGVELPIIQIDAQAPTVARAAQLANAATAGLRDYLNSQAALDNVANANRLRVDGLGAAQAQDAVRGPKRILALGVTLFVFFASLGLILAGMALARAWRAADDEDYAVVHEVVHDDRFRAPEPPDPPRAAPEPDESGPSPLPAPTVALPAPRDSVSSSTTRRRRERRAQSA